MHYIKVYFDDTGLLEDAGYLGGFIDARELLRLLWILECKVPLRYLEHVFPYSLIAQNAHIQKEDIGLRNEEGGLWYIKYKK